MDAAREQEILWPEPGLLDPGLQRVPAGLRDLELDRPLRLLLQDDRPGRDLVAVADIADLEIDEVTAAQLAVDAEVEHRELSDAARHLRRTRSAQMSFSLSGTFWPTILPLFQGSRREVCRVCSMTTPVS